MQLKVLKAVLFVLLKEGMKESLVELVRVPTKLLFSLGHSMQVSSYSSPSF